MITLGFVLAATLPLGGAQEKTGHDKMVEIVKVEALPSKTPKRQTLSITFNLIPDLPKGVKVEFELQCQSIKVGDPLIYTLENETRKNIRMTWTPKDRLIVDKYVLVTRIPLAEQTPETRKT